ncbi:MAG TPA: hypothetical protein VF166_03260 [Gemmatimonadaceae bacterium]
MNVPEYITAQWIDSLTDDTLLAVDQLLHRTFAQIESEEKARRGSAYDLMRGPVELTSAWDRWTRVNSAARARRLRPLRV